MRPCLSFSSTRESLTCFSKLATRLRSMPKMAKKSFQKLYASARSDVSPAQRRENSWARLRISFQESGMGLDSPMKDEC
jgi:hypothetical protein